MSVDPRARAVLAVALVALGLLWVACSRDERLTVRKVLVDVVPGAEGPGGVLEREKLRAIVEERLRRHPRIELRESGEGAAVLRVRLESTTLTPKEGEGTEGTLSLALEASGALEGRGRRFHYQGHSVASASGQVSFPALVEGALDDCLDQVLAAKAAQRQPSETLLAWLDDPKTPADQKRQAVRLLGARKEPRAAAALTRFLKGEDKDLAQAALGALTLIGEPSAVDAVIEYAEGKPSLIRKQAIEAVRVMGSRRGMAWLFTLSTGHRDPDVQATAAAALAQLEARAAAADPTKVAETQPEDE